MTPIDNDKKLSDYNSKEEGLNKWLFYKKGEDNEEVINFIFVNFGKSSIC